MSEGDEKTRDALRTRALAWRVYESQSRRPRASPKPCSRFASERATSSGARYVRTTAGGAAAAAAESALAPPTSAAAAAAAASARASARSGSHAGSVTHRRGSLTIRGARQREGTFRAERKNGLSLSP